MSDHFNKAGNFREDAGYQRLAFFDGFDGLTHDHMTVDEYGGVVREASARRIVDDPYGLRLADVFIISHESHELCW